MLIQARELTDWRREGVTPELPREEIIEMILTRLRPKMDAIWDTPIGISLHEGWEDVVSLGERFDVNKVVQECEVEDLSLVTLRQFKKSYRAPLAKIFSLLARIESIDWVVPYINPGSERDLESAVLENVPANFGSLVHALLAQPWIFNLKQDDLRYGFIFSRSFKEACVEWAREPQVPRWFKMQIDILTQATARNVSEEMLNIAEAVIANMNWRGQDEDSIKRWVAIVKERYCGASQKTLQDVGKKFGLTRERARQVLTKISTFAQSQSITSPVIDSFFAQCAKETPKSEDMIFTEGVATLADVGISALIDFCVDYKCAEPTIVARELKSMDYDGKYVGFTIYDRIGNDDNWMSAVISYVHADCSYLGATNLQRVAGWLAIKHGIAISEKTLNALVYKMAGFRNVGEASWFTTCSSSNGAVANRVLKIMCLATEPVNVDSITEALATDLNWIGRDEDDRVGALVPVSVLRDVITKWPWVKTTQHNRFSLQPNFFVENESDAKILSESERIAVSVIENYNGVAVRHEIAAPLMDSMSSVGVNVLLAYSPIFVRVDHGIYSIRGRKLDANALIAARKRYAEQK